MQSQAEEWERQTIKLLMHNVVLLEGFSYLNKHVNNDTQKLVTH